jgi:hypothetical protein
MVRCAGANARYCFAASIKQIGHKEGDLQYAVTVLFAAVSVGVLKIPAAEAQLSWATTPNPWGGSTTRCR